MFLSLLTSLYLHLQHDIIPFCYSFTLGAIVELTAYYESEHFLSHYFSGCSKCGFYFLWLGI